MQIDNFKAENNYVIIEHKAEGEHHLDSGLVLLEKNKWADLMGGVIKVQSDSAKLPEEVSVGTKVFFFEKDVKSRFYLDSNEYLTIKCTDLLAFE